MLIFAILRRTQTEKLNPSSSVLESLISSAEDFGRREAQSLLGKFMFSGDDVDKKVSNLSEEGAEPFRACLSNEP